MTDGLEGGEIVFGFLVACHEVFDVEADAFEAGFGFAMFADFGPVLGEDLGSFGVGVGHGCLCFVWGASVEFCIYLQSTFVRRNPANATEGTFTAHLEAYLMPF